VSTTGQIVAIIAALASLFLVVRNFKSHGISMPNTLKMAAVWAAIILAVMGIVTYFADSV
jgi:hypothetical protein